MVIDDRTEWLEPDGRGGFASGTTSGVRSRRYHALLLTATTPPTGRCVLVNGIEVWLETPRGSIAVSTQRYAPDVLHPDGTSRLVAFTGDPWPAWTYEIVGGARLSQELLVERATGRTVLTWTVAGIEEPIDLCVRPLLSGRDYHALHHENGTFRFEPVRLESGVEFRPYDGVPAVVFETDGTYAHAPDWYRRFLYGLERERGLDDTEDLASPGMFRWTLTPGRPVATLLVSAGERRDSPESPDAVMRFAMRLRDDERARRTSIGSPLDRAADAYIVQRGRGKTIVAGYPWFTDWGRDTFIALRGLCLATGRLAEARDILLEWAGAVSQGMLPNRFPDSGEQPEFNSVDASLWYVVAVGDLLDLDHRTRRGLVDRAARQRLEQAILDIVSGYQTGTRFRIRQDADGLLSAGIPGQQLTWMDARIGDWVVTPRIGKPVEIQALWVNALAIAARIDPRWRSHVDRARAAFADRFWCERGFLADVVDVNHEPGTRDETFRPNQILAVGGLPHPLVEGARARQIVDAVERHLLTPLGLRSLAPEEPGFQGRYQGGPGQRDAVYHQGTVWPWLMGPFVEAWLRVHGDTTARRAEARRRFVEPLMNHLSSAGLGHVSEICDAEDPFTPRGCPFQAWSVAELLRLNHDVLQRTRVSRPRSTSPALASVSPDSES